MAPIKLLGCSRCPPSEMTRQQREEDTLSSQAGKLIKTFLLDACEDPSRQGTEITPQAHPVLSSWGSPSLAEEFEIGSDCRPAEPHHRIGNAGQNRIAKIDPKAIPTLPTGSRVIDHQAVIHVRR